MVQSNLAALLGYRLRYLSGDLTAGLVTAIVAIPHCLPLGIIAFAPLGPDYAGLGAAAGIVSSIVGGIFSALFGSSRVLVGGPRVSSALLMAATLGVLVNDPTLQTVHGLNVPRILSLLFLYVIIAGVIQVGFGVFRFGRIIKFIPYPVIAGFMNGVALLMLLAQYQYILGLPHDYRWRGFADLIAVAQPGAVLVAVVTVASVLACRRFAPRSPILIFGVLSGSAVYFALMQMNGGLRLGDLVGEIPRGVPMPVYAEAIVAQIGWNAATWESFLRILPGAAVLALMASVESLLSALSADTLSGQKHDANRELIGQGLGNIACGLFGAVPSAGATTRVAASYQAGGRTPLAAISHGVVLLLAFVIGGGVLSVIPEAVLGGVMVFLAVSLFDDWSRQLFVKFARLGRGNWRGDLAANLVVVVLVFTATVVINPIVAVGLGVLASMILFVRSMSKSIIRRTATGDTRHSLRVRDHEQRQFLIDHGRQIVVVELDGPLFFGTGDQLTRWSTALADHVRYVILDFRRVAEVDATGARMIAQMAHDFASRGGRMVLAHLVDEADRQIFHDMGVEVSVPGVHWFSDADHALEWAEDRLLEGAFGEDLANEIALAALPAFAGCSEQTLAALSARLERRELTSGEPLFHEGDAGTELFFLVKGRIDIELTLDDGVKRKRRLSTLGPGAVLGEMALFAGAPRSADAVAASDAALFALSDEAFVDLLESQPDAATQLLLNIGRELSSRLAITNQELRLVEG